MPVTFKVRVTSTGLSTSLSTACLQLPIWLPDDSAVNPVRVIISERARRRDKDKSDDGLLSGRALGIDPL